MFEFLRKKPAKTTAPLAESVTVQPEETTTVTIPVEPIVPVEDPRFQNAETELTVTMSPDPDDDPEETEVETDDALIPVVENVQVFRHERFGEMRVVQREGEPWFVAADVCKALELSNSRMATDRLDDDEKADVSLTDTSSNGVKQRRSMTIVSEPGLYSLALGSRKPEAKAFKRWVTHEVIPAIRKTGGYIAGEKEMTDEELLSRAVIMAQQKLALREQENKRLTVENAKLEMANMQLNQQIEVNAPKVRFAESFRDADGCVSIAELAKLLCERGYSTGEKRLFSLLREEGYLCKTGSDYNQPAQRWLNRSIPIFALQTKTWTGPDGNSTVYSQTMVTPAGITYFFHKFLGENFRIEVDAEKKAAELEEKRADGRKSGRAVQQEKIERYAAVIRQVIETHPGETKPVTMAECKKAIPELANICHSYFGKAMKAAGVEVQDTNPRLYQMPASLFEEAAPEKPAIPMKSTHAARTQLVRVIIAGEKAKGTGTTLMTADQFLTIHRDKLGDMSVANLEAAFRACGVESDTSYGALLWKLPA